MSVKHFLEDSEITLAVKAKLGGGLGLLNNIKIETNQGVVSMEGELQSNAEAETAVKLAFSVEGVGDVDTTKLRIQGSQSPIADALITAKIKGLYIREKLLGEADIALMSIHLETVDGVVFITGEVENEAQAEKSKSLATSVQGVKQVKADLTIKKG